MGNKYYTPDIEEEMWKDIPGYEEYYEASNTGLIRRKAYIMKCRMTKETILKRLLLENHITVEELVILAGDIKKEPVICGSKTPSDFIWKEKQTNPFVGGPNPYKVMYDITITSSKL